MLKEKARQGVAVRVIVDQLGSDVDFRNAALFDDLAANGVQVVRNDPLPLDHDGLIGGPRPIDWRLDELAHLDHRKAFVVDGRIAWVGGAGIEDHFVNGTFHDAYARVEGEAVGQVQLIFLASFRLLGGPLPTDQAAIEALMPAPAEPGLIPTTVLHNVPRAGHLANTDAIEILIEGAERRLDVMSPYSADQGTFQRMMAAAQRGVKVRFVVPAESNVPADRRCTRALVSGPRGGRRRGLGAPDPAPREGRARRRPRVDRDDQPRRLGALPELGDRSAL